MAKSLLDLIHFTPEQLDELGINFGRLFPMVTDSVLTMALLFFLARWIFDICVALGNRGWK